MSIVGPRPERTEIIDEYEKTIPKFSCRLKVKGGLTEYIQIYGEFEDELLRNEKNNYTNISFSDVRNFSFILSGQIF